MTTAAAPRTVTADALKLYACATCAQYHTGGHDVDGVEEHVWRHYAASTQALGELYAAGDYKRFFRAVLKAKAIRGHSSAMDSLWHHALTLSLPEEHSARQTERAHECLPGLLRSLASDDYRHAKGRGLIHPVQRWGC